MCILLWLEMTLSDKIENVMLFMLSYLQAKLWQWQFQINTFYELAVIRLAHISYFKACLIVII